MQKILHLLFIGFLAIIILRTIYYKFLNKKIIEGASGSMDSTTYVDPGLSSSDPLYLAKLNAANIAYLKEQIDSISDLKTQVDTLNEQVESNSSSIDALNQTVQSTQDDIPDSDTTSDLVDTANTTPPSS